MCVDQQPDKPLRLVVQQPSLAKYRVPVFRELASRPGIDLKLIYGQRDGIPNVDADGFDAQFVPMTEKRLLGRTMLWHKPQLEYADRDKADVLSLSWDLHYASLIPALLKARQGGVGTVLWGHGYSKQDAGWRARARSSVAKLADALLFYNHTAAEAYIRNGFDPDRVFVALNAIDQTPIQAARAEWTDQPEKIADFRRQQGLGDAPVLLFVSRLEEANRADMLIEAQARLSEAFPSLVVAIIGKGPDRERLEALAADRGLSDRVRFLGAIYDESISAPWFMVSTAFCYPANIGLSILHGMGYGLPVVTSAKVEAQNPEIEALRDGENGFLYRDGDVDDLASKLKTLLTDRDLQRRLASEAHATATQRFSLGNMVDGYVDAVRFAAKRAANRR